MKKSLMVIPMVLLIAAGCSDETVEMVEKEPVVDVVEESNKRGHGGCRKRYSERNNTC